MLLCPSTLSAAIPCMKRAGFQSEKNRKGHFLNSKQGRRCAPPPPPAPAALGVSNKVNSVIFNHGDRANCIMAIFPEHKRAQI